MRTRQSDAMRVNEWRLVGARMGMLCGVLLGMGALAVPASGNLGGIAGYAGAPGDPGHLQSQTCVACHVAPAFPVQGTLSIDVPAQVDANQRVNLTVEFNGDETARWGFNLIALVDGENGEPVGTLAAGTGSQILLSNTVGWQYLTHTLAGTENLVDQSLPGWEVQWQAPAQETKVRFYATFNAADGLGFPFLNSGDTIFAVDEAVTVVPEPGLAGATAVSLATLVALRRRRGV